jgi:hypothetical protein
MRPNSVVVAAPAFDDDPGFLQGAEDLAVEQLVTELRVEALAIAILPWAAGLDIGAPTPAAAWPLSLSLSHQRVRLTRGRNVKRVAPGDRTAVRRRQIELQVALITPLIHVKGFTAPET